MGCSVWCLSRSIRLKLCVVWCFFFGKREFDWKSFLRVFVSQLPVELNRSCVQLGKSRNKHDSIPPDERFERWYLIQITGIAKDKTRRFPKNYTTTFVWWWWAIDDGLLNGWAKIIKSPKQLIFQLKWEFFKKKSFHGSTSLTMWESSDFQFHCRTSQISLFYSYFKILIFISLSWDEVIKFNYYQKKSEHRRERKLNEIFCCCWAWEKSCYENEFSIFNARLCYFDDD